MALNRRQFLIGAGGLAAADHDGPGGMRPRIEWW